MTVDRSRLPVPGKTPPFHFPAVERSTLSNGLRVWTVRHVSIPVATVMLLLSFALLLGINALQAWSAKARGASK